MSTHNKLQHITAPNLSIVSTLCNIISGFVEIVYSQGGFTVGGAPNTAEDGVEMSETTSAKTVTFADDSEHEVPSRTLSYIQRNPTQLPGFLGKIFVFVYTWAFGGNLHSQNVTEDVEDGSSSADSSGLVWKVDKFLAYGWRAGNLN